MSEVQSRPSAPRGRGTSRGGRGAFSARGGRGGARHTNGHKEEETAAPNIEEEGEMGELKKTYFSSLGTVKEMFPSWTDEDIIFALQETDGDLQATIERISEGNISQWGEVKKKNKDRAQSKFKDASTVTSEQPARGGRGRGGHDNVRGGRGRGADRGRGVGRGGKSPAAAPKVEETPADSLGWDNTQIIDEVRGGVTGDSVVLDSTPIDAWESISPAEAVTAEESKAAPKPSSKPDGTRSWASMFSKPAPPKANRAVPSHDPPIEPPVTATSIPAEPEIPGLPPPISESAEVPSTPPVSDLASSEQAANITPSKDDLTETNLEQVLDVSAPAPAATAASTIASTVDPATQPQKTPRPPLGGFATSAYKATGMPGRSASYQRKIQEQQEAVVMPGKHAIDRANVQFGSLGLNGTSDDPDVDSDREDAETRAQPPQHSPIAPRAALPPAPQQQAFESLPRQAPGLPQPPSLQQTGQNMNEHGNYPHNRYGPQPSQQEISPPTQKPYEPFGQQAQQHDPSSSQPQQPQSGYSSAGNDSSYYTSDNQRNAYQNSYYSNHTQPHHPEMNARQSAFGTSPADHPTSQAQSQSRFAEAQNSGHSTPNPSQTGQHQMHQQQAQGQAGSQYPYGTSVLC